ncbi:hypothetical protein [Arthrobacter sp. SAFR-014]|uniref:hypothetical protein n=1 Tax=unclassified Arthrobacter TaxID=235627 RepID=UPI003F7B871A
MRQIDTDTLAALDGSRPADTLTVWAWRDGELIVPEPLQVIAGSATESAGDSAKIGHTMELTVGDPDGTLGAWKLDDPLGVAGTELQVIYNVGRSGAVNYGWFRITDNTPDERVDWRTVNEYGYDEPDGDLPMHKRKVAVVTAVVKLSLADRTINPDRDKFDAPQSPPASATAISEIRRLTREYFPLVVDDGITDVSVPRTLIYDRERLEAVQDLASRVGARYRMGGDGEMHLYPIQTASMWRVEPGQCLVRVARSQSLDGLYNKWVVEGKEGSSGKPVRAFSIIDSGPLAYGGPHGKASTSYSSEMIADVGQALAYAIKLKNQFLASLAVELEVECTPRPELQAGDRIEVGYPVAAGHVAYFPGEITDIHRGWSPIPTATRLTVSCSYADVVKALGRTEWAQYMTDQMPELTWDLLRPGTTWGNFPDTTWEQVP